MRFQPELNWIQVAGAAAAVSKDSTPADVDATGSDDPQPKTELINTKQIVRVAKRLLSGKRKATSNSANYDSKNSSIHINAPGIVFCK